VSYSGVRWQTIALRRWSHVQQDDRLNVGGKWIVVTLLWASVDFGPIIERFSPLFLMAVCGQTR